MPRNPPLSDWLDHAGSAQAADPRDFEAGHRAADHLDAAERARRKVAEIDELLRANDAQHRTLLALRRDEVLAYDREYDSVLALLVPPRAQLARVPG